MSDSVKERIYFDERWMGDHGIGRFAREVNQRLKFPPADLKGSPVQPLDPLRLSFYLALNDVYLISPGFNSPLFGGKRFIPTIHDLNHIDTGSGLLRSLYYRLILKRACQRAPLILTVSNFSRKKIVDWAGVSPAKVVNVGNGLSPAFATTGTIYNPGYKYLLCIGNRKPHKNEERVVQAFARAGIDPTIRLVFNGEPSPRLIDVAMQERVDRRIVFLGPMDDEKLASVYRGGIALIFPSLYEGFGFPVIEAMASGIPVLTSSTTSLPEVAGSAALLVEPSSTEEIAAGIHEIVTNMMLRESLIQRGFEQSARFTWDKVADKILEALTQSLGGHL